MNEQKRGRLAKRLLVPVVAMGSVTGGVLGVTAAPVSAAPYTYACAYWQNVNLFGGGYKSQGCPPQTDPGATANSLSPAQSVAGSQVDLNGATGSQGPAKFFSSPYDLADNTQNSGRLDVNVQSGATWAIVTAKASTVGPSPFWTHSPGYAGPWAAPANVGWVSNGATGYVEAKCTNSGTNEVGQVTIKNGFIDTSTGQDGYPTRTVAVATNPAINTRVDFTLDNVGDSGYIILNEQISNADGTKTVNGMHMYMMGTSAYGDLIIGQARCGA